MITGLTEYHAAKARAMKPPMKLTTNVWPYDFATLTDVLRRAALNGILGIQLMKQKTVKTANSRNTMPPPHDLRERK